VVEATPFRRDILKELSEECRRQGIRMGLYYSIMDWQHPDYLPRRSWEDRSAQGADFRRYVDYMKAQLRELIDRYDPAILWFDGEWEPTWSHEQGVQLYNAVRSLKPDILVNNRVDTGRGGRPGGREARKYVGDFGTPEQEVPAAGTPGYDWESCMTMNRHWGWNKNDKEFKSTTVLIRQLIDCASKGGNYLLNVGPKPDGTFPQESIERLGEIGRWMKVNGQSIYGTTASVFPPLPWGRSTTKDRTLYLHVFERPAEGRIWVPGLISEAEKAYLLADPSRELGVEYADAGAHVRVPSSPTDRSATVIALEFRARPEVVVLPEITGAERFYPSTEVRMDCGTDLAQIHYTLDSTEPTQDSQAYTRPLQLDRTVAVQCRVFHRGVPVTPVARKEFTRLRPKEAEERSGVRPGLRYRAFLGRWEKLPAFSDLTPDRSGTVDHLDLEVKPRPEFFAIVYEGYVRAPQEGLYAFSLDSDDGSRLYIGGELVVDNDGLHSPQGKAGVAPLKKGLHPIRVEYLQGEGGALLDVTWTAPDAEPQEMPADLLFHL